MHLLDSTLSSGRECKYHFSIDGDSVSPYDTPHENNQMIQNYKDQFTEQIANGSVKKGFPTNLIKRAQKMLFILDNAKILRDVNIPPGNKLHALTGDREGSHAVWINGKWRICFNWTDQGPVDVEIVDYH